MARKLTLEARMTIKELSRRGWSNTSIASTLKVTEGTVRYHRRRQEAGAVDGRSQQPHLAMGWKEPIKEWLGRREEDEALNLAALHEYLVAEHDYPGSLRSVQRYYRAHYPAPRKRARRRVEVPPGSQAQADWAEFRDVWVAGVPATLYAFHLQLSHSRFDAVVWSPRKDQLSWQEVHNGALERLDGVPATIRVDNEKTAMARGAGVWGEVNPAYRRYALSVHFHVDACAPRSPEAKGKVERRIRDQRLHEDPRHRPWDSLEQLQAWSDERVLASAEKRRCPATGGTVRAAWEEEKRWLGPLPILPEPFDLVVRRKVALDCTVQFEARTYSVPFAWVGQTVEVRGAARTVQIFAGGQAVACHPRHTAERVVLDPRHFEGEATAEVLPPLPLGKMGRRLQEIAAMTPQQRPLDLYAALAEVAR